MRLAPSIAEGTMYWCALGCLAACPKRRYILFMVSRVGVDWRVERLHAAVSMRVSMALA